MFTRIRNIIEQAKRLAALKKVHSEFYISTQSFKDIPIYTSDNLIYGHTGIKDHAGALVTVADGKHTIFINSHFKSLPECSKNALLCHEYAHVVLKHLETIGTDDALQVECDADEYAQFILEADVIGTLTSMYQSGNYTHPHIIDELKFRINNLTQKVLLTESFNFKEVPKNG